jgi:hypothetical protein
MDERRKTVNVACGVTGGVQMRLHQIHEGFMGSKMSVPIGDLVELKAGGNPGIDKQFFEAWLEENKNLSIVTAGLVTATDEEQAETEEVTEEPVDDKSAEREE